GGAGRAGGGGAGGGGGRGGAPPGGSGPPARGTARDASTATMGAARSSGRTTTASLSSQLCGEPLPGNAEGRARSAGHAGTDASGQSFRCPRHKHSAAGWTDLIGSKGAPRGAR